ncbi:nucleotide-sugar transporter-domain-containing protein [Pelagophyceae sp. CCMP2097]|nr:nucleotide-sugar transporter-domain-containing protein [Pelagophyceae sp. CCMP2097]
MRVLVERAAVALAAPEAVEVVEGVSIVAHVSLAALLLACVGVCVFKRRDVKAFYDVVQSGNLHTVSPHAVKVGAFAMLVALQTTAILLFKACQVTGQYTFSPAASICITEMLKFCLSASFHSRYVKSSEAIGWFDGVTPRVVANYAGLALLYTVNNYITFRVHLIADPGSYTLGKSVTPYLVAIMLRCIGQRLHELQWICIIVQCCSIAITQYEPCAAATVLPREAYLLIGLSACITATCGVWNQQVIKGFVVAVNMQNMILYTFGALFALVAYIANEVNTTGPGFFTGFTALPILLIFSQATQGLAVTVVLKYADAIVKNFAGSAVMAILVVVSANFFHLHTSLNTWLGVVIVLVITYTYMAIATQQPQQRPEKPEEPNRQPLLEDKPKGEV